MHKIGLASDIEKAFLQVGQQETEHDVTRFLWLKDLNIPQAENNLQFCDLQECHLGLYTVLFCLEQQFFITWKKKETEVAKKIERDIYMDNVITGENSTNKAVTFYHEAKLIFQNASMNLREWISNYEDLLTYYFVSSMVAHNCHCEIFKKMLIIWKFKIKIILKNKINVIILNLN